MRNNEEEGIPLLNIERNPIVIIILALISAVLIYYTVNLFRAVDPLGFLLMMPTAVISFQTLWIMLHPFAIVYENKVTIRQSLLHHKDHYFIDLKKISGKDGKLYMTYHDGDVEMMKLFGIKKEHISLLKTEMEKYVTVPSV